MELNLEFVSLKNRINKWEESNPKLKFLYAKIKNMSIWGKSLFRLASYLLLFDLAFIFLYPFLYMIITSLKSPIDVMDITVEWIPRSFYFSNYEKAAEMLSYFPILFKTSIVTILATLGHIFSCSMVAYGFARYKFPLKNVLFNLVLLTIIVPIQVLIFSLLIMYSKVGWLNTYLPLIVPTFFGFGLRGGLFIFIFRQFFAGLPYELEEAARIDGCNAFRTYWTIVLPVAGSALLVCIILSLVWHWNDYFEPTMYILRTDVQLLPSKLPNLYILLEQMVEQDVEISEYISVEGTVMAGTFLVILPILIVYLFLQKKFMEGIERSGLVG